jgi:LacI family transcriptional regulator
MIDIAERLGVAVTTVSKALADDPAISELTRTAVRRAAKELGYRPNTVARNLVRGVRGALVGFLVPEILNPFFAQVGQGILLSLREQDFGLAVGSCEDDAAIEAGEVERLMDRGVEGLLLATSQAPDAAVHYLLRHDTPVVLVDRRLEAIDAPFVGVDDRLIGRMATEHLIELGCRRIAHIGGERVSTAVDRLAGFRDALAGHGLAHVNGGEVICGGPGNARQEGAQAMRELLLRDERPDGVFCCDDFRAIGALSAILDAGLHIPHEIRVVGVGNHAHTDFLRVPLTTVDQNCEAIGDRAGRLLLSALRGQPGASEWIAPRLVVRQSTVAS